jgi:excisionase family DNA binding protein
MPKVIGDITLYTLMELAKMLDVTDVTLRRYIKDGKLHATKIGGSYHISEQALKEFLEQDQSSNNQAEGKS